MFEIVTVLIIAGIFLFSAFKMKASIKKDKIKINNYKQAFAIIDKVVFSDIGNAKYYVTFIENGNKITAQTRYYSSEKESLNSGDEVKIRYFFAKRNGAPRAIIEDDRVVPISNFIPSYCKFFTIIGLLLLAVAVGMFVNMMFF